MIETIILKAIEGYWAAQYSDSQVYELFGTDTLPTPFPASKPIEWVKCHIQNLNPTCLVIG